MEPKMDDLVIKMEELELRRRRSTDGKLLGYEVIDTRNDYVKGWIERYNRGKNGHNKYALFTKGYAQWFDNQLGIVSSWLDSINSGKLK